MGKKADKQTNDNNITLWTHKTSARKELDRAWGTRVSNLHSSIQVVGPKHDKLICTNVTFTLTVNRTGILQSDLQMRSLKPFTVVE
jgi:hypothetical protein